VRRDDYVLKSNPKRLVPAVERALQEAELRRTSQLAEQQVARLTSVLQMLSGINSALVRIQNRDEVMDETAGSPTCGWLQTRDAGADQSDYAHARPVGWPATNFLLAGAGVSGLGSRSGDTSLMGRVIRTAKRYSARTSSASLMSYTSGTRSSPQAFVRWRFCRCESTTPRSGLPLRHRGQRRYWSG